MQPNRPQLAAKPYPSIAHWHDLRSMFSSARLFWRRAASQLRTIVPGNFQTGRLPDLLMLADVLERSIEGTDAVRQARQIGVEGNMHDASGCGAFTIEGIELPAYRVLEISRGRVAALEG